MLYSPEIITFSLLYVAVSAQWDYCSQICGNKTTHTLCKYPRSGPGPRCSGYIYSRLVDEEKARIVGRLNQRRNQAAMGQLLGLPTASNMLKLCQSGYSHKVQDLQRWVDDLAKSAQRWGDQCIPPSSPDQRDECRDLYVASAGQAIATITGDAPGLRVEALIDTWYMQSMLFQGNVTYFQTPPNNKNYYGDFTQIMWAKSYMVGCERVRFMVRDRGRLTGVERLVCNFAPRGNLRARPIWMPGKPCARCPANTNCYADYPGLCHYRPTEQDNKNASNDRSEEFSEFVRQHLKTVDGNTTNNYDYSPQHLNLMEPYDMLLKSILEHTNKTIVSNNVTFEYADDIEALIREELAKKLQIENANIEDIEFMNQSKISNITNGTVNILNHNMVESLKHNANENINVNQSKIYFENYTNENENVHINNNTKVITTQSLHIISDTTSVAEIYVGFLNETENSTTTKTITSDDKETTKQINLLNITMTNERTIPPTKRMRRTKRITPIGRPKAYELDDLILRQTIHLNPISYFAYRRPIFDDRFVENSDEEANVLNEEDSTTIASADTVKNNKIVTDFQQKDFNKQSDVIDDTSLAVKQEILKNLIHFLESDENDIDSTSSTPNSTIQTSTEAVSEETSRLPETREDLQMILERAEREHAKRPPHVKVRRELRERHLEALAETTLPPTATLPPLLRTLVYYFPFLSYEAKSAAGAHAGSCVLKIVCVVLCLLN